MGDGSSGVVGRRAVVVGEALVDLVCATDGSIQAVPGGAPANVAVAAARLGAPVAFAGAISHDRFGRQLRARLSNDGVSLDLVTDVELPTTLALAEIDAGGSATYRFYLAGTSAPELTSAPSVVSGDVVVTGGLALVLEPMAATVTGLIETASRLVDVVVMVDVNARLRAIEDLDSYRTRLERVVARAHLVKVSDEDLGVIAPGIPVAAAARSLLGAATRVVVLTAGSAGTTVFTTAGEVTVPAVAVEVVDTVGAGDTFVGAFVAHWIGAGNGVAELADIAALTDAVAFANGAAAITCTRVGADPPHRADVDDRGSAAPGSRRP